MDMFKVTKRNLALKMLSEEFRGQKLKTESVTLSKAKNRVLASDILSMENVPSFNRSTVDGYAVKAESTVGASDSIPAFMTLTGEIKMGTGTELKIIENEVIYVPTGGIIPEGADAVVMIEYTESFGDEIAIYKPIKIRDNVVKIGDDIKLNDVVLEENTCINVQHIGVLAALGIEMVDVYCKPNVSIISTGDELVEIGEELLQGQIRDINSHSLKSMVESSGCEVINMWRFEDDFDKIQNALKKAVVDSDLILISGGSSVGTQDMTPEIINALGKPGVLVHGIAIKPGKPTILARIDDTAIFGLPGHPASCMIAYQTIVDEFISKTLFNRKELKKNISAKATFQLHASSGRDVFYMVKLENTESGYIAHPVHGKSGMITLLSQSDGYIEIPMNTEGIQVGKQVKVHLFN